MEVVDVDVGAGAGVPVGAPLAFMVGGSGCASTKSWVCPYLCVGVPVPWWVYQWVRQYLDLGAG